VASKNFINNHDLHIALVAWLADRKAAIANNQPLPPLPDYVGQAVLLMAEKLSRKVNFGGYSYREDLVGEGILSVVKYLHNYDPSKTNNPFAYITQILHNAFVRFIQVSKAMTYKHMLACETSSASHESYRKAQLQTNREHVGYQAWRKEVFDAAAASKERAANRVKTPRKPYKKRAPKEPKGPKPVSNIRHINVTSSHKFGIMIKGVYYGTYDTIEEAQKALQIVYDTYPETTTDKRWQKAVVPSQAQEKAFQGAAA
jgi:hypothetical protein